MNEDKKILKVALDVPIDQLFDYLSDGSSVLLGQQVKVPFGKRVVIGVVCEFADGSSLSANKLKKIISTDNEVLCDKELLHLIKFSANYYHHPIGQSILSIIPTHIKQDKNVILKKEMIYKATSKLTKDWVMAIPNRQQTKKKLADILIKQSIRQSSLKTVASNATKVIQDLKLLGICSEEEWSPKIENNEDNPPTLNKEQIAAINQINKDKFFHPWLLFGITGSGKTEVYLNLIHNFLKGGDAQILVLVPEINLTPQLENRFHKRFPHTKIATLHSNLNTSERLANWRQARSGAAQIILGTRLAIYTPIKNLKLIIIDEEHDMSFKQQEGFKYHARDIALVRARNLNIPIVLGTATPSLESWLNTKSKDAKYKLLKLNKRAVAKASLPVIKIIPTNQDRNYPISALIIKAIQERINRKEQVLVFINRRGFAPLLVCGSCGWSANCKRCSAKLVVHLNQKRMKCHHCGYERKMHVQCEDCGNTDLHPVGSGTQKVEDSLREMIPTAKVVRVDRDSMRKKNALENLFKETNQGKVDILVGTQMLAKGHDFPNLTLVIVLGADNALYSTDLRASERLFSQLMQVAGRAGRGSLKGEVMIETNFPNHPIFQAVKSHDYEAFANSLLDERKPLDLPPYSYSAILKAESKKLALVETFTNDVAEWGEQISSLVQIFGPVRPVMERVNGYERINIYVQSLERKNIQNMLNIWLQQIRQHPFANKIKWNIDVDPI